MVEEKRNCHGCKWLDEVSPHKGDGYCCKVLRSKAYEEVRKKGAEAGIKVRHENDIPCDLYEAGDFKTRYDRKVQKEVQK